MVYTRELYVVSIEKRRLRYLPMTMRKTLRVALTLPVLLGAIACSSSPGSATPPITAGTPATATAGTPAAPGSAGTPSGPTQPTAAVGGGTAPVGMAGSGTPAAAGSGAPPVTAGTGAPVMPTAGTGAPIGGGPAPVDPNKPTASEWRMIGYDLGSTYNNTAEKKLTRDNAAMLAEAYTVDMGTNVYGAPLQIGDTIYASASTVRALDAATGQEKWKAMFGTSGSMSYADNTLYLHGTGGRVTAISATDGKMLWQKPSDTQSGDGSSSPLVIGDLVIVGGSNGGIELAGGQFKGFLSALNRKDGQIAWTTYTVGTSGAKGASIWSSASGDLAAGVVYASTGNNYGMPASDTSDAIIAFDMMTGDIKWKAQRVTGDTFSLGGVGPDADFGANPVLYEVMIDGVATKLVAAGNKGGDAHAVRQDNGMLVWTRKLCMGTADGSRGVFVNSTWDGKNMLMACNEGGPATLYALDGATGNIAWMRKLDAQVWGRITVANGVGFVGVGTKLEIINTDTGAVIKTYASKGGTVAGTISVANGRVAFGSGLAWSSGQTGRTLHVLAVP